MSPWVVEPALEYRILTHASSSPLNYQRPSIHRDGRILAVGTDRGVVLWDLARGTELALLPTGLAWHTMFDVSGDLLANTDTGFWRWPIHADPEHGEVRIEQPSRLSPIDEGAIAEDRTGRIIAVAAQSRPCHASGQNDNRRTAG